MTFFVQCVTITALAVSIASCFLIFSRFNFLKIITTIMAATKNMAPSTAVKILISNACLPFSRAACFVTGYAEKIQLFNYHDTNKNLHIGIHSKHKSILIQPVLLLIE